jgi:phosphopantetheinyl transferase
MFFQNWSAKEAPTKNAGRAANALMKVVKICFTLFERSLKYI